MEMKKMTASLISLPRDIIFEILLRLRVKILCRFRCVSKSWHALISNPIFHRSHHNRSKKNPLLLTMSFCDETPVDGQKRFHFISLDKEKNPIADFYMTIPRPWCWHSSFACLDLVLMDHDDQTISLFNPATEERIVLPPVNFQDRKSYRQLCVYFGRITNAYKILSVFIATREEIPTLHFEILSFDNDNSNNDSHNWRAVDNHPPSIRPESEIGTCVNGAAYMMLNYCLYLPNNRIARFDLECEEWSLVALPESLSLQPQYLPWTLLRLYQARGLVCLMSLPCYSPDKLDLWSLKDCYKNIWVKEYSINLSQSISGTILRPIPIPLAFEEDGRVLMEMGEGLAYYDPMCKTFETISVDGHKRPPYICSFYVESFMSLGTR